jgi:hypothetical protein
MGYIKKIKTKYLDIWLGRMAWETFTPETFIKAH